MRSKYRWVICALLFFATAVNYLDRQVLSLTWKDFIAPEFKWTDADYGLITGYFSLIYAVCNLFAGKFVDWMGSKRGYLWAIFVWSLAACLHAACGVGAVKIASLAALSVTTVSVWLFLACRSLLAVGESGNFPAAIKVTAECFPPEDRAFATSIFNSGASIGALVAPLTIPLIARHCGWEAAFVLIGALGFVWMGFWTFLYRGEAEVGSRSRTMDVDNSPVGLGLESTTKFAFVKLFTFRQTWALMIGLFLTNGVWWFFLFWIPGYLSDQFGYSSDSGMGMLLVFTLYAIVTVVSIGLCKLPTYLMVKMGMRPYAGRMRAMFVFACLPLLALGAQPLGAMSAWFPTVLIALACAGHQAWSANVYSVVGDMFPKPVIATLVGIAQCAGGVGSFLVNILAGRLFTCAASRGEAFAFAGQVGKPAGYMIVFCYCGIAYLLAWACMKMLVPQGGVALKERGKDE